MRINPPRTGLRALNVKQPYANEIEAGSKPHEFRTWDTAYRGDLLIVVSANPRVDPFACTLCIVDLFDVEGEPGDYAWCLRNPRPVKRVPVLGKLKLWRPDEALLRKLGIEV
jgi:hypothetical protein